VFSIVDKIKSRLYPQQPATRSLANKLDRIQSLEQLGVPISSVVDIGVQDATRELISALPHKHHHLFEPVKLWHAKIKKNYSKIGHTLYPVALSCQNGTAWLVQTSLMRNGVATHAYISSTPSEPNQRDIVDCEEMSIRRLDEYSSSLGDNFLLKIDVDGKEIDVLNGAIGCLPKASIVIIEADYASLTQRGHFLEEHNFQLIDIIDRVMYGEVLWQCDLVYLRNDLMNETLRPPFFDPKAWKTLP